MTRPEESQRSALGSLRQYLPVLARKWPIFRKCLLELANSLSDKLPSLQERLLELARKVTDKIADDGHGDRERRLRSANEGLKAYLPTEAPPALNAIADPKSGQQAPSATDEQLIGDLIRRWMEHDPLSASWSVVDTVGLGGAHRLPEGDRLRLARAFLAMLEIDPSAVRWSTASAPAGEMAQSESSAAWTLSDAASTQRPH